MPGKYQTKKLRKNRKINMNKKSRFIVILVLVLILPAAMIMLLAMTEAGRNTTLSGPEGPCDIYTAAGSPLCGCAQQHTCFIRFLQWPSIPGFASV